MTPVFTGRVGYTGDQHGPWTLVVCTKLYRKSMWVAAVTSADGQVAE